MTLLCLTSLWISICSTFGNPMFPTFSIVFMMFLPFLRPHVVCK
jgi:hypothetical protein